MSETKTNVEMEQKDMPDTENHEQETGHIEIESKQGDGETVSQVDKATSEKSTQEEEVDNKELTELHNQLAEAEQRAEENYQKYLRAQADFDNFRRRTRQEKEDQAKYASLPLIEQLLPILDNFERALAASQGAGDVDTLIKGVDMVFRQVEETLQKEGLEVIEAVGIAFDPNIHQAVMMVESEEYDSGVVVEEIQKGYKLKDRVIRPAMVKVSS